MYRLLLDLLEFYAQKLSKDVFKDVSSIEICLGGDHGKSTYLFVAILLFRYKNNMKESYWLELKIGEINEPKD